MRHLHGETRHQSTLLPDSLNEYVAEETPVRVIDAFIEGCLKRLAESSEEAQGSVQDALTALSKRQKVVEHLSEQLDNSEARQCCETEPEARRMRSVREGIVVGYNIQTAVEANDPEQDHFICPAGRIPSYQTYHSKKKLNHMINELGVQRLLQMI